MDLGGINIERKRKEYRRCLAGFFSLGVGLARLHGEMRPKSTNSVKKREQHTAWHLLLTRWQLGWAGLGAYLPYFQLGIRDYLSRLKMTSEKFPNEAMFSPAEVAQRRQERVALIEAQKIEAQKIARAGGASEESLVRKSSPGKFGRLASFLSLSSSSINVEAESKFEPSSSVLMIQDLSIGELFTREERQLRLDVKLKALKRTFRSGHRQALDEFKQYKDLTESLPEDEMDMEILGLEHDYVQLGRVREWFGEFHELVREVVEISRTRSPDIVLNEDPTRVLQRDFLTQMKTRLKTYRRLSDLRHEAFLLGDAEPIRLLSYFKTKLHTPEEFIDRAQKISVVKRSLAALEYQLGLKRAERALMEESSSRKEPSVEAVYADQETRLENWLQFKRGTARDLASLKKITPSCEDWHQQVALFESEIDVQRLENHGLSPISERSMVEGFVRDMVVRIDQEIETDIAFQQALQHLISSGERPEMLNLALEQLKLARSKPDASTEVPRLKAEFVQENANVIEQLAQVIPLFRK